MCLAILRQCYFSRLHPLQMVRVPAACLQHVSPNLVYRRNPSHNCSPQSLLFGFLYEIKNRRHHPCRRRCYTIRNKIKPETWEIATFAGKTQRNAEGNRNWSIFLCVHPHILETKNFHSQDLSTHTYKLKPLSRYHILFDILRAKAISSHIHIG